MKENPELAKRVKQLRTKEDYTWRAVAEQINQEFPNIIQTHKFKGVICVNQIDGIDLCSAARVYLGEEVEKDGWN